MLTERLYVRKIFSPSLVKFSPYPFTSFMDGFLQCFTPNLGIVIGCVYLSIPSILYGYAIAASDYGRSLT